MTLGLGVEKSMVVHLITKLPMTKSSDRVESTPPGTLSIGDCRAYLRDQIQAGSYIPLVSGGLDG